MLYLEYLKGCVDSKTHFTREDQPERSSASVGKPVPKSSHGADVELTSASDHGSSDTVLFLHLFLLPSPPGQFLTTCALLRSAQISGLHGPPALQMDSGRDKQPHVADIGSCFQEATGFTSEKGRQGPAPTTVRQGSGTAVLHCSLGDQQFHLKEAP